MRATLAKIPINTTERRRGAIESHLEESCLDFRPRRLADHEIAADIEQDPVEPCFDAKIAKPAAIELALPVQRRHHDRVGVGLDGGLDEIRRRRERAERDDLVARFLERHRQDPVADDMRVGADDAGDERPDPRH